jgi:protein SCO1
MQKNNPISFGSLRILAVSLFLLAALVACRPARHYPFSGEILAIDRSAHQLIVRHGDIPQLMRGMTMPFVVNDPAVLDQVQVGEQIKATLVVTNRTSWLEDVEVTAPAPPGESSTTSQMRMPSEGAPVPDFVFTNQDGKRVRLSEYKGKIVLLTFIYTRCPLPDFCPRMTNNFLAIEKSLKEDSAVYGQTHLLSVTFDPEFDTPTVLRHYALSTTSIPAADLFRHWEFLVPQPQALDTIARFFGLSTWKQEGTITHSLSTSILDRDGKLYRWYHGNDWTPEELLKETRKAAGLN